MEESLSKLGFSPRKAKILSILLKHPPLTVHQLVDLSGIQRPHVYTVLKELINQGFVVKIKSKPHRYTITSDKKIFEELVECKIEEFNSILHNIISLINSKSLRGTVYFSEGASLKREFENGIKLCEARLWFYIPFLDLLGRTEKDIIKIARRGVDVRIAVSDDYYIRTYVESPSYIRYIEPARPFFIGIIDSNLYFGFIVKSKIEGGFMSNEEDVLKQYSTMFEHIWIDDYAGTLYRVKSRVIEPY
ncbi:MAG: hypothetical protein B6U95_02220 [Thermofilum sp. ex4484_82]|nr:MAG: hypothetical protein B6U95_02220 [Thermofilum sp. ex4484_82]OYT39384.1 MAG: hypothetical protein B6U96_02220 [Archaeoglobales archaeon ex4484_92]